MKMKRILALFAIVALLGVASPASAWHWSSSDITVGNTNSAYVKNSVDTTASTGGNDANGGNCGGGFGNDGGNGGFIATGEAAALSAVENVVNTNDTKVKTTCGCRGDVTVGNSNRAMVKNYVDTTAKTGYNDANGGNGGGGFGNDGGNGGMIFSGSAGAGSGVANLVNSNITRIRR